MNIKTITASSIHAALLEARRQLGDDVVLLESVPPRGSEPARITVMSDAPAPKPAARPALPAAAPRRAPAYGYAGQSRSDETAVLTEETAVGTEAFSGAGRGRERSGPGHGRGLTGAGRGQEYSEAGNGTDYADAGNGRGLSGAKSLPDEGGYDFSPEARALVAHRAAGDGAAPPQRRGAPGTPGRGSIFANDPGSTSLPAVRHQGEQLENLLRAQLQLLHDRLDQIERRFESAVIGAAQRWTASELYAALLQQGMHPPTLNRLFEGLAGKGYRPDTCKETLKWALAQEMRRALNVTAPKHVNGAQVFIGPSGSGKTSLLLKLAAHPGFYGRRDTAVIVILPEEEDGLFFQSPAELFRRFGLPVQTVRNVEEMRQAIFRVQHYEQILIDTPPLPLQDAPARKMLAHVKRLVAPIVPLQVQLVLNATRALEDIDTEMVQRLALRPDVLALTHLDETPGWGRIAEWLIALKLPVRFVSTSPRVPDGVIAFSPTWFVEELMKL
jgi:flagellar biosynthesis protein FlhF